MKAVLEGLLFISGDDGISMTKIKEVLEIEEGKLNDILKELYEDYEKEERGITIKALGQKIKLVTKSEHKTYYEKYFDSETDKTLSNSALEVLAIIAYNEPITRITIDEVRGVSSSHVIRKLLIKNMVEIKGKSDLPGRPNLYGVTDRFLDYFGLSNKEDLPVIEVEEKTGETELFDSKYKEN
jgi:segregation and condensation protein B